jgi:TatD DNase family protein
MSASSLLPSTVRYVDAHCHVDLFPDPMATMRSAREQGIAVVAVTNTPSVFRRMQELAEGFESVFCALGLHPELVAERQSEIALFKRLVADTEFVGEVGLDGTEGQGSLVRQRHLLEEILAACQESGRRVLSVHSRRAGAQILEVIDATFKGTVILHWFSGSLAQAREATERGWYFSINITMARSQAGQRLVRALPMNRVLTESDAPLARFSGQPSSPKDVVQVVACLADSWRLSEERAARQVVENFAAARSDLPHRRAETDDAG